MSDDPLIPTDDTLLAHLIPRLSGSIEDAATEALAYILNKSKPCREALADFVTDDEFLLDPVVRVRTQLVRDDQSRLDLVGFDSDDSERLIIESKFWAPLLEGQASGYVRHLDDNKSGMLLFVAPEARRATLWSEVCAQMRNDAEHPTLTPIRDDERLRVARVGKTDKRVALTSWVRVLEVMKGAASELTLVSEIEQLTGLATSQGDKRFAPFHPEDLSVRVPRRISDLYRIISDLVDAPGVDEEWMDVSGRRAAASWDGYGRNFRFTGVEGRHWIGVSFEYWGDEEGAPIWLYLDEGLSRTIDADALRYQLPLPDHWEPSVPMWLPIRIRLSAAFHDVLDDVVDQLKTIYDAAIQAAANNS